MGDSKRWTVTYTKHMKQKRKLYQDGFLHLQISTNKVALYDEFDKLLDCRLLKKDETVTSGDSLEFNAYLVDIGDPEGQGSHNKPQSDPKGHSRPKSASRFATPSNDAKDTKMNASKANIALTRKPLSPSQQIIKEFKKREMLKYGSPQLSPETKKPSTSEWRVLYTTQVTQKAKKYHDGFLRLVICGSRGGQVMLFDESKKLLDSRFLKKDDVIRSGESIAFDAYLVDIGELHGNHKPDCSVQGENCSNVERVKKMDRQHTSLDTDIYVAVGKSEWQVLYTTQLKQKAKKYHDGFLQLEFCGSHGRQVVLCDSSKRPLERRFLKKDEVVRAGESVYFDGHLVDIREPIGSHQSPMKLNERETGNPVVERRITRRGQNGCLDVKPSVSKGQPPSKPFIGQDTGANSLFPGIEEIKSNRIFSSVKPLRDANQILSILQDPLPQESCLIGGRSTNGSCHKNMDSKPTETMKSEDATFSKSKVGSAEATVDGGFQLTRNAKMPHQPYTDKEAQTNMSEADVGLYIVSSGDNFPCAITTEGNSAEEFSCKMEKFPSFDLGF